MKQVIYVLIDPRDQQVRYVGYSKNLFQRVQYHYMQRPNKRGNRCSTFPWLVELCELGMLPQMKIVEVIAEGEPWEEREQHWIRYYENLGAPLLNRTKGGRPGGWSWRTMQADALAERRERQRQVMREMSKKYWADKTPEQRSAIMRPRGERTRDLHPEHLSKIGSKGRRVLTEMRSNGSIGPMSEETKSRISKSLRKKWESLSPEERELRLANWHSKRRAASG